MDFRNSHEDQNTVSGAQEGKLPWTRKAMLLFASLLVVGMAIGVGLRYASAAPAPWVSLPQSVAPQVATAKLLGSAPDGQVMHIGVTLQSKSAAMLKAYAQDVAKPHSKVFHQYLTPAQFALNFGANAATLNAVEKYFQSQGMHLDGAASGGLFLQFTGTSAQVGTALHTHINLYHGADGRTFFANANALQLPSALAPSIIDVAGTENARVSHPAGAVASLKSGANTATSHVRQPSVRQPNVSVTCPTVPTFAGAAAPYTATGLLPTQLNKAYNFQNTTNPGNGMWAAFVEMDGYSLADLAQYASCVGISSTIQTAITASATSSTPFIITQNVTGGMGNVLSQTSQNFGTALTPGANASSVEEELEVVLGLVPNITHITVLQTANTAMGIQTALATLANENAAQVVGYQWGMCEADIGFSNAAAEEQTFMQMALQGQTVLAATGNNGLYACAGDGNNFRQFGFSVQDPASDPFVTAVGGTELGLTTNVASTAALAAEQPWNNYALNGNLVAGGAGISMFWAAPSWQQLATAATTAANGAGKAYTGVNALYNPNVTSTTNLPARIVPDVSAAADAANSSVAIYCSVGTVCTSGTTTFTNVGGTTEAEAIWVAAAIEANQTSGAPTAGAGGRLSNIAPVLYTLYGQDTAGSASYALSGTNFCDYTAQLGVATTSGTAVTGVGSATITPASMTNIIVGSTLLVDTGGSQETVTVTASTGTTFTATFTKTHAAAFAIVGAVNTTTSTSIGPGLQTVTPTTGTLMENILVGETLAIAAGGGTAENVVVTAITASTFTANFQYTHAALTAISLVAISTQNTSAITVGSNVVTPTTGTLMQNIFVGESVHIAAGGGTAEDVAVTAVTSTTFTATFSYTHTALTAITLTAITTQATSAVTVGVNTIVPTTGTLMSDIYAGESVHFAACGGTTEDVTVISTTATTFNANFLFTHTALCAITPVTVTTQNTGALTVTSAQTITPVSMTGIITSQVMVVGGETVTVTSVTSTTFTATGFLLGHAIGSAVATGVSISTNSGASTVTATLPAVATITPANMVGIYAGQTLKMDIGGSLETVTVTSVTATTLTATFTLAHSLGFAINGRSNSGTIFNQACATAANFVLNNSAPLAAGGGTLVTSSFPQNATYNYQQLPTTVTALYGSQAGFAVKGNYGLGGNTYLSGFNALTGLGSPNVGPTTSTAGQLLGYLTQQSRVALARTYMVAQGLSDNKYWIASYGTNPYVSNMPTSTAWYPLNTVTFSGAPVVVDDGNAIPANLFIIGPAMPTATGLAMYQWNIATGTASQVTLAGGNLPGAYAGSTSSCTSISATTDGTSAAHANNIGVYCVTSTGALYSTDIQLTYVSGKFSSAAAFNWTNSPLLNAVSYAPQVASDNAVAPNFLVLETNTSATGVYYQYFTAPTFTGNAGAGNLFPYAVGAASGLSPFSFGTPLATTCLTTPSAAYVAVSKAFAVACTASDTKQMWDNVYFPGNGKFNGTWSLLGQPSSSVTFLPGNAVSVDNVATDPAYGQIFYIAEGSDKAMYLEAVNAQASRFLGKGTGWMSVSLPGIFNSNSGADFANS